MPHGGEASSKKKKPNGKPVDKKEIICLKVKLTNFCLDRKSEFE